MRQLEIAGLTVRLTGGNDGDGGGDGLTVVLMHGFGAPGTDLVPLAGELDAPHGTRFVFPEAPLSLPPELGAGRAWWMIDMMRLQLAMMTGQTRDLTRDVPEGLAAAREAIVELLDVLVKDHGVRREDLVLGGFSQGAMLACDVALRTSEPLAALVLMSGTLLAEEEWRPLMPKRAGLRVLQSHGRADPLLPFDIATLLRDALNDAGLPVRFVPFEGGHGIAPVVLDKLGELLRSKIAGP
jgi:phospholipase/carboxylesterase